MTLTHGAGTNQQYQNGVPSKVKLMIHHQYFGIELVSPLCACDGATCHLSPDQKVIVGSTTQADFNIDLTHGEPIGILMYELKNKKQFSNDAIYSKNEATYIRLVMIWKMNNSKEFCVVSRLMEHDKGFIWNRDKLIRLAKHYYVYDLPNGLIEYTYLIHDNTVLRVRADATRKEEYYNLEVTISEGNIKENTWRPRYTGLNG
jgi:hypothetical protein